MGARIVHHEDLPQPAVFCGRKPALEILRRFLAHDGGGVLSVEGIGGSGKSALVAQALQSGPEEEGTGAGAAGRQASTEEPPRPTLVFVWSFYLRPDSDAFLLDLYRERTGRGLDAAGLGRADLVLEALRVPERGTVLILDGLERIQAVDPPHRLEDAGLECLLRGLLDAPSVPCRCVVTTRFPLATGDADLDARIERLPVGGLDEAEARELLRIRGVVGDDEDLDRIAKGCAGHALALSLAAGALQAYLEARADRFDEMEDAKLLHLPLVEAAVARVLGFYRRRLDPPERALLERVCLFRAAVEADTLRDVFLGPGKEEAAGDTAGMSEEALRAHLEHLHALGLLERTATGEWIAHPVVQQFFPVNLSESSRLHAAVADFLTTRPGITLTKRDREAFDQGEEIIYHLTEADRFQEAFRVYWKELGASHVLSEAGESARGERMVRRLLSLADGKQPFRPRLLNELAIYLSDLSRLEESARCYWRAYRIRRREGNWGDACRIAQNLMENSILRGLLRLAGKLAAQACKMVAEHGVSQESDSVNMYTRYLEHLRGRSVPQGWRWIGHQAIGTEALMSAEVLLRMRFFNIAHVISSRNHRHLQAASRAGEHRSLLQVVEAAAHLLLASGKHAETEVAASALEGSSLARILKWSQSVGDYPLMSGALMFRAFLYFKLGRESESRADLERVLAMARRHGLRLIEIDALVRLAILEGPARGHEAMLLAFRPETRYLWVILTAVSLALPMMEGRAPGDREATWISAVERADAAVQERRAEVVWRQQQAAREESAARVLQEAQRKAVSPDTPRPRVTRSLSADQILDESGLNPGHVDFAINHETLDSGPLATRLPVPGHGRAPMLVPSGTAVVHHLARLVGLDHPEALEAAYSPIWNTYYQAHLAHPDAFSEYYHLAVLLLLEGYDNEAALAAWDASRYGVADLAASCLHAAALSRSDAARAAYVLEEAVKRAHTASSLEISTAEYDLGVLYESLGRLPEARRAYERASRADWTLREARVRRDRLEPDRERCRHVLTQVARALDTFRARHARGDYPGAVHELVPRFLGVEAHCPVSASPYDYRLARSRGRFLLACRPHALRLDSSLGDLSRALEPAPSLSPLEALLLDFPGQAVHFHGHTRVRVTATKLGRVIE